MTAIGRLAVVSLDTTDPKGLADFYCQLLDYETVFTTDEFVALKGPGVGISTQLVKDHVAPDWPGATKPAVQPNPDTWRVLLDPAGHPFCITTMIPDDF